VAATDSCAIRAVTNSGPSEEVIRMSKTAQTRFGWEKATILISQRNC
jgi:hypothetical protein